MRARARGLCRVVLRTSDPTMRPLNFLYALSALLPTVAALSDSRHTCRVSPLGHGRDDTDQVLAAIARCGHGGTTIFEEGSFNITRKMTWDLVDAQVDLYGRMSFVPDIDYWLNATNTYRVVFIQDQASWFVITGTDFTVDAHGTGGIQGNGQPWWNFYTTVPRLDGDGRPIALTVYKATRGVIRDFTIDSQPFWCNCVAESKDIVYDGMKCNATNTNPEFFNQNIVPNTDGIDTFRSENVALLNWDITCGDDCIAIKGNSTNVLVKDTICRGGNGIAFGSLAQYVNLTDKVQNVLVDNATMTQINTTIQPNMNNGVYFKSWDGSVNGVPPTGGGGGPGFAKNITLRNIFLSNVSRPTTVSQTNDAKTGDLPSIFRFEDISWENWRGNSLSNEIVALECSAAVNCTGMSFSNIDISIPAGETPKIVCQNAVDVKGITCS
ncbi:hypothetical protein HMN09_00448200 [Mycena chlorophos]|uniref:galacturonan 1,4-alpha-galacturonidase n=1 Tax=Mycena chlorophos TaxID=658473 RepID=A0A8H6TE30_MYCCL|nr:hypothetical protein HMN09_00448200 [Mycena chlorophos]